MLNDSVYRDILALAPDGIIVVDENGRIQLANDQLEQLFGYSSRELQGRPIELLVPTRFRAIHQAHRAKYVAQPRTRPMGATLQLTARRKDGSEFPVEISLSPLNSGNVTHVTAIVRDISERRRAEETIRAQAALLDMAHDSIILLAPDRSIEYWNTGAERTYGWTAEEALGQHVDEFLRTSSARPLLEIHGELLAISHWEGELEQIAADGRPIVVTSRQVLERGSDGQPRVIMQIDRDVTERRELERERERLAIEAARQGDRDRIAMDLHDGIIQSIYAATLKVEYAADEIGNRPETARTELGDVVQRLGRVIEEMREYIYELTSEQNRPLQERIEELVRSFSTATDLRTEVAIVSPLDLVGADRVDIAGRIVQEALTNVHRHAKASSIVVSVDVSDGILQLEVKDDGVGFDPGAERGDGHRGLRNISSRVDNLGGTLDIDSAPSAGTRIRARIPLA